MDLEYKITTSAELAGANAAAEALERQIGKAKALKQDYSELDKQLKTIRGSVEESTATDKKATEVTEGFSIKKKELLESVKLLRHEFPLLGEAIRMVFNPVVFGVGGIIASFVIWKDKVNGLSEAMGGMELPDLSGHIGQVEGAATAYDGVGNAIRAVDEQFNSATGVFDRQQKAINSSLTATKALLEAQKQLAIAQLDAERASGKLSPAEYDARKSGIERGYSDQNVQAEIAARNASLEAKKKQLAQAEAEAAAKTAKANSYKLPEDDKDVDAQMARQQQLLDNFKEMIAKRRAEIARIRGIQNALSSDNIKDNIMGLPGAIGVANTYGAQGSDQEMFSNAIGINQTTLDDLVEKVKGLEQAMARRGKMKTARSKDRSAAEAANTTAENLRLGIAGEEDPENPGSTAFMNQRQMQTQGVRNQAGDFSRLAGDFSNVGKDIGQARGFVGKNTFSDQEKNDAENALKDAYKGIADASQVIRGLGAMGKNMNAAIQELNKLRAEVDQLRVAVDTR
jgi:hypothetical protein